MRAMSDRLGQREPERAAFAHFALDADPAAMQLDQAARERESQPRSFILPACGRVELGKLLEQLRLIFRRDPNAGVGARDADLGAAVGIDRKRPSLTSSPLPLSR